MQMGSDQVGRPGGRMCGSGVSNTGIPEGISGDTPFQPFEDTFRFIATMAFALDRIFRALSLKSAHHHLNTMMRISLGKYCSI